MRRGKTQIFSIFGQIEEVAAEIMIRDGEATKLTASIIPESEAVNEIGQRAKFAVVICGKANVSKFEALIADLRA